MDDWAYVERQVVNDPKGRAWTIAIMDLQGQARDPDLPSHIVEAQQSSGRYFTLIYSSKGGVQWERGHASLDAATREYGQLLTGVVQGRLDPAQPVFRQDLEDPEIS
jgi:hypothetical protein